MLVTTTNSVEGREIIEYCGIVFGEVITGVNFVKDIGAGIRDFIGGRSKGYEKELISAREEAIEEIAERAKSLGADAVVGAKMDYEVLGASNSMMMVTISGTAVKQNNFINKTGYLNIRFKIYISHSLASDIFLYILAYFPSFFINSS